MYLKNELYTNQTGTARDEGYSLDRIKMTEWIWIVPHLLTFIWGKWNYPKLCDSLDSREKVDRSDTKTFCPIPNKLIFLQKWLILQLINFTQLKLIDKTEIQFLFKNLAE